MHLTAGSDGDYLVIRANGYLSVVGRSSYEKNGEVYGTERWFNRLRDTIGYPENSERFYTFEDKKYLYDKVDGICQLCHEKIQYIEDAQVDHIKRYSEGGKTTIENGQITHKYCNLKKD